MAKVGGTATSSGIANVGFAKLQGENFEYYMQTYSIILGRSTKKSAVDVDLQSLGGGPNISRLHARLFYDFERRNFALEVIGRDGCLVQGVFYSPGNHHVELRSQYLLQFGDLKFYFLLPKKSIFAEQRGGPDPVVPFVLPTDQIGFLNKETGSLPEVVRNYAISTGFMNEAGSSVSGSLDKVSDLRLIVELEEKDIIKSMVTLVCDLYRPGDWIPIAELHAKVFERYGRVWHPTWVRNYLINDLQQGRSTGKPWSSLLALLSKHPEHFLISTRSSEEETTEFVTLVILIT